MNKTEMLCSEFKPKMIISVYEASKSFYLESHEVNVDGQVLAGKPLLQETIQGMVDIFFDERKGQTAIKGIIPDNLLSVKHTPGGNNIKLVWYRTEEQRVLHHSAALKLKTDKAFVPAMLYVADKDGLSVYALGTNKRPTEDTILYAPPFFNTDDDGSVCLGSAQLRKTHEFTYSNLMQYWEDLFWRSTFTHVNGGEKVKSGNLQALWKSLVGTGQKFPSRKELISLKRTLKSLI